MALPEDIPSTIGVIGSFLAPDIDVTTAILDYERGGVAVQDTSQGVNSYVWACWVDDIHVTIQREGAPPVAVFEQVGILEISFAFDQNMRPQFAYKLASGDIYLRWFDTQLDAYVTNNFGTGRNPRLALDDKRPSQSGRADVIFAYIRGDTLYYRQQRDRYTIERSLRSGISAITKLKNIGMTRNLRLLFELV